LPFHRPELYLMLQSKVLWGLLACFAAQVQAASSALAQGGMKPDAAPGRAPESTDSSLVPGGRPIESDSAGDSEERGVPSLALSLPQELAPAPAGERWSWRLAPYLWATAIDGTVALGPAEGQFEVDFDEIFESLDGAFLLALEARKGRVALLADFIFLGLESDGQTPGGVPAEAELDSIIVQVAGMHSLSATSPVQVGLGLRYSDMQQELDIGALSSEAEHDAFDGFVAAQATWPIAQRWFAFLYGDIGAGDSDLTWQAAAMLGYQFDGWGLDVGYRALAYEFEDSAKELDLVFQGLLFGVEFNF
jgi:hypothetical protein